MTTRHGSSHRAPSDEALRGRPAPGHDGRRASHPVLVGDAYRALELLATHRRNQSGEDSVIGFSKGGRVAVYGADAVSSLHGQSVDEMRLARRRDGAS